MGLKEECYAKDLKLKRLSMIRENYINGKLFEVGDKVVLIETREKVTINKLCNNYVEINLNGDPKNVWISDICKE
jgi:homoaconitase/3-isopropylmalate dehydratase large subunit